MKHRAEHRLAAMANKSFCLFLSIFIYLYPSLFISIDKRSADLPVLVTIWNILIVKSIFIICYGFDYQLWQTSTCSASVQPLFKWPILSSPG